jgi:hypothetical protein
LCSVNSSSPGKLHTMRTLLTKTSSLGWLLCLDLPQKRSSGPRALKNFSEDGFAKADVPNETLESVLASSLERTKKTMTVEESEAFLAFMSRTLTWTDEKRASASELRSLDCKLVSFEP